MELFVIATIAFVCAGFVKGVVGFGFPVVALIILTLATGLLDALALVVIPALVTNLWQAFSGGHLRHIFRRMWRYYIVAIAFIWITSDYLEVIEVSWLTGLLGVVLLLFSLSSLLKFHFAVPRRYESILSIPLGALNGVLTALTGSFMVPSVLYMQAIGFRGDLLVQAMGVFFSLSVFTLALSLQKNDLISIDQAKLSVLALIPSLIGLVCGRWLRTKINEERIQTVFLLAVLLLGVFIVLRSARKLAFL